MLNAARKIISHFFIQVDSLDVLGSVLSRDQTGKNAPEAASLTQPGAARSVLSQAVYIDKTECSIVSQSGAVVSVVKDIASEVAEKKLKIPDIVCSVTYAPVASQPDVMCHKVAAASLTPAGMTREGDTADTSVVLKYIPADTSADIKYSRLPPQCLKCWRRKPLQQKFDLLDLPTGI